MHGGSGERRLGAANGDGVQGMGRGFLGDEGMMRFDILRRGILSGRTRRNINASHAAFFSADNGCADHREGAAHPPFIKQGLANEGSSVDTVGFELHNFVICCGRAHQDGKRHHFDSGKLGAPQGRLDTPAVIGARGLRHDPLD